MKAVGPQGVLPHPRNSPAAASPTSDRLTRDRAQPQATAAFPLRAHSWNWALGPTGRGTGKGKLTRKNPSSQALFTP